jgi:hypothetical protein
VRAGRALAPAAGLAEERTAQAAVPAEGRTGHLELVRGDPTADAVQPDGGLQRGRGPSVREGQQGPGRIGAWPVPQGAVDGAEVDEQALVQGGVQQAEPLLLRQPQQQVGQGARDRGQRQAAAADHLARAQRRQV